jgi:hypothetical protein
MYGGEPGAAAIEARVALLLPLMALTKVNVVERVPRTC